MSSSSSILQEVVHRPWPLPKGPWLMHQTWCDLMFAHWPIVAAKVRPLVSRELTLETFGGQAWIAVTPFHMQMQIRGLPPVPYLSHFPEINCRTYVTCEDKPGIFFFSLDAGSRMAVWGARTLYHLPYFFARMLADVGPDRVEYSTVRLAGGEARFVATYKPEGPIRLAPPGSLEHWLTERYCLYTLHRGGLYRGEIHHVPWPLQTATAEIRENTMAKAAGVELPDLPPLLHFARKLEVLVWPLQRVGGR